ncbi:MAG: hypothetical protein HBSAPP03_07430 [Phycisphaerae bacterium]|nr:MAG: hypothetical protein HBSAPP03_07430 [Phycisphaerae bacterium]
MVMVWTLAVVAAGLRQPPAHASAEPLLWFNSAHLAGMLDASITGHDPSVATSPLSERGRDVLAALSRRGLRTGELFENPSLVASVVLSGMPASVAVVPTEQYFYFEMLYQGEWIAGNLRVTDADRGILHCGYYLRAQPNLSRYAALSAADGLCVSTVRTPVRQDVEVLDEKTGARTTFVVADAATLPFAASTPTLADEQLVSPIIDESGTAFNLIFNHQACEFYYVLVAASPDDPPYPIDDGASWRGARSGFIYVPDHAGRLILAGVHVGEVAMNTFYDGPFDQVPPRLSLRELIRWAYPGIEDRRSDSLDAYGTWTKHASARVAIAPYMEYTDDEAAVVRRAKWLDAARHAARERATPPVAASRATRDEVSETIRAHAHEWPQSHDLRQSAATVLGR